MVRLSLIRYIDMQAEQEMEEISGKKSEKLKTEQSCYRYRLPGRLKLLYFAEGAVLVMLLAEAFYGNVLAAIVLLPFIPWFVKRKKLQCQKADEQELKRGFKECLLLIMASVNVGYSLENAWKSSLGELKKLLGPDHTMVRRLSEIVARLNMNENIETVLDDFARDSHIEEARSFCEVIRFAKRSGGNYRKIINRSVVQIGEKIDTEAEINTLIAGKKLEQRIMSFMPLGICLYLKVGNAGYLDALYGNLIGILIMTACLVVYGVAFAMAERIVDIEV